jgi:hypothetical protein
LASDFPDYAALAHPEPLSIAATQDLLGPDEVLVQFFAVRPCGLYENPAEIAVEKCPKIACFDGGKYSFGITSSISNEGISAAP